MLLVRYVVTPREGLVQPCCTDRATTPCHCHQGVAVFSQVTKEEEEEEEEEEIFLKTLMKRHTGISKSRFTVVHMENNTIINN